MAPVTGKQAGALERVASAIETHAAGLEASRQAAVQEVHATTWQGVAADTARMIADDLEAALTKHITQMRKCAEDVRAASAGHEAADAEAGDTLRRVNSQLQQLAL